MFACKSLVLLSIVFCNIRLIVSCGCYGRNTCTPDGDRCHHRDEKINTCLCDCCPACSTCKDLLQANCFAYRYLRHYTLSNNQSNIVARLNESVLSNYILDQRNGEIVPYLWDPCLRRPLPTGISLINNTNGSYKLVGTPREKLNETSFEIIFKGTVNQIIVLNFTISVI